MLTTFTEIRPEFGERLIEMSVKLFEMSSNLILIIFGSLESPKKFYHT